MTWYDCHSFHLPQARTIRYDPRPKRPHKDRHQGVDKEGVLRDQPGPCRRWHGGEPLGEALGNCCSSQWKHLVKKYGSEKHQISLWNSQEFPKTSNSPILGSKPTSPAEADGVGRPGMCGWLAARLAMRLSDPWSMVYDDLYGHPIIGIFTLFQDIYIYI